MAKKRKLNAPLLYSTAYYEQTVFLIITVLW